MAESDGNLLRLVVRNHQAGLRIEKLLSKQWPSKHWSYVQKVLRQSRVVSDGIPLHRGQVVWGGQVIEVLPAKEPAAPLPNKKLKVEVLHETADVAVVFKPCGRAVHPGPGHGSDTLLNGLIARYPELLTLGVERGYGLVHRLDLETSGPLAVARTEQGYDGMVEAFREHRVEKRYRALVQGRLEGEGVITDPVDGKDAETRFTVLERAGRFAKVDAFPISGRTHQIRVHLAGLESPILGDPRYGTGFDEVTKAFGLTRLALHCERLAFTHPVSGEAIEVLRPSPKLIRRAWKRALERQPAE